MVSHWAQAEKETGKDMGHGQHIIGTSQESGRHRAMRDLPHLLDVQRVGETGIASYVFSHTHNSPGLALNPVHVRLGMILYDCILQLTAALPLAQTREAWHPGVETT